jgi:ATP-binding cassette subfamily G (WHITE) protein 2 (SNQ2)
MSEKLIHPPDDPTAIQISPIPSNPRTSSEDTIADADAQRENARQNNPNGYSSASSHVSVTKAEEQFAELQRQLSGISEKSRRSRRQSVASRVPTKDKETDVERAAVSESVSDGEPFDLEDTLRGNKATDEEAGIRSKRIGVLWDNLTVTGQGGVTNFVKTFPDAFTSFFNVYGTAKTILGVGKKGRVVDILQNFRGVVKPGEMVLVLGRPGSGCTTFLKVIANQRYGYSSVTGEVQYGPFDAATFAKRYRGEATYNQACLPHAKRGRTNHFSGR